MRSKIEANEYKDYILGFIFYKFLCEKEEEYIKENLQGFQNLATPTQVKHVASRDLIYLIKDIPTQKSLQGARGGLEGIAVLKTFGGGWMKKQEKSVTEQQCHNATKQEYTSTQALQNNNTAQNSKKMQIRNSTVDFLIFVKDAKTEGIEVRVQDGDVWLTQKGIAKLFDVERSVVSKHLKNIFESGELLESSVCANFAQTASDGKTYQYQFYALAAIIAVGYRTNSERATQFRQWATKVLEKFAKQGYVLDKNRLENGKIFDDDYFDALISEIQEIRASERRFYQKITDIYATACDYSVDSATTKTFFAAVQNKLHFAVHGHTASELIMERANHEKKNMGLTNWKNAPNGKIIKSDVSIAKNYLAQNEIQELNEITEMYLDYATRQARRHKPMTMEDWAKKLDAFLKFNEADILSDKGKVTAAIAKEFAESEFEKFRIVQDESYVSDFDRFIELENVVEQKEKDDD